MPDSPDSPPPGPAKRKEDALRRRAEALRENLKRRKAQARGRKAGMAGADPRTQAGEAAEAAPHGRARAQEL